jgi:uncharacterized OsmC-like protein
MATRGIGEAIERVRGFLSEHPDKAHSVDIPTTARIDSGLRVSVEGPDGRSATTDMPTAVGGGGTAGSPGWLMRAAHAACDATVIAMCAAEEGIELNQLEVTVDSDSDDRGLLGLDGAPAGPLVTRVRITISAAAVDPERLRALVDRAELRSPVGQALRTAGPVEVEFVTS